MIIVFTGLIGSCYCENEFIKIDYFKYLNGDFIMLLLSICIPSYDRFDLLNRNLESIFSKAKSKNFEVVVIDNCSPKDIMQEITIRNPRLRIIKRKQAVSGPRNGNESLSFAEGKYALLCLDKDGIRGEFLDDFLGVLEKHPEVCGGACAILPPKQYKMEICKKNRAKRVKKFGYTGRHPSGDFYRTSCIKKAYDKFTDKQMENTYAVDWLLAECAAVGDMMTYDYPLMIKSPEHKEKKRKSSTYSPKNGNVFFLPPNLISQFYLNYAHLQQLEMSRKEKLEVLSHLYRKALVSMTVDYRMIMCNKETCFHYYVEPKYVSSKEMLYWWYFFIKNFLKSDVLNHGAEVWIKYAMGLGIGIGMICEKWRKFL